MQEIIKYIVFITGAVTCLAGGIAMAGFAISLASNYAWTKIRAAHSLIKLQKAALSLDSDKTENQNK